VLLLTGLGFRQREIAQRLAVSEKAVETIVYRHRKRLEQGEGIA